jgi:CheY-like chemotaxis protein
VADAPDQVLLDMRMPNMSGVEVCKWFKQNEALRNVAIIFTSGLPGIDEKIEAFRMGGDLHYSAADSDKPGKRGNHYGALEIMNIYGFMVNSCGVNDNSWQ